MFLQLLCTLDATTALAVTKTEGVAEAAAEAVAEAEAEAAAASAAAPAAAAVSFYFNVDLILNIF